MRLAATVATLLGIASCVLADIINIKVGDNGVMSFVPESINAKQGDIITFHFVTNNHSVTQSSFNDPCTKLATLAIDSDFQPTINVVPPPQWNFTLSNVSVPLWFFCKQGPHCREGGMVFAINPTADETFLAFQSRAMSNTGSSSAVASAGDLPAAPSATDNPAANSGPSSGALELNPPMLAKIIPLVAVLVASFL